MKVLVIQHSAADAPAAASSVLERDEHSVQTVRIDRDEPIPESVDADALMMFGGPVSLTSGDLPPWVAEEMELIRRYVQEGRRVMGICLGSQMIARALGAEVTRNAEPEIGWHPIEPTADADDVITDFFPPQLTVMQWHQDTFGLPAGARHVLRSQACEHQGFTIDDRVFAFQFHLEANPRTVDLFMAVSDKWKRPGKFVQGEEEIKRGKTRFLPTQTEALHRFLYRFLA